MPMILSDATITPARSIANNHHVTIRALHISCSHLINQHKKPFVKIIHTTWSSMLALSYSHDAIVSKLSG